MNNIASAKNVQKLIHLFEDKVNDKQSKRNLLLFIFLTVVIVIALILQVISIFKSASTPPPIFLTIGYGVVLISLSLFLFLKIDLSTFKVGQAITFTILILAVIEGIYANFLKNINTNITLDSYIESDQTHSILPGQKWDTVYNAKDLTITSLEFFVEGDPPTGLAIKLVSEESNKVFFDRQINENEFTKDNDIDKSIISISSGMIHPEFDTFPTGVYHICLANTNTSQEIEISVKEDEENNPMINVSTHRATMGGYKIALFLFLLMITYLVIIYTYSMDKKICPEKFFLMSVIPLSVAYLILMPSLGIPDAGAHFSAAYRLSNILLNSEPWVGRIDDINYIQSIARKNPDMRDILLIKSNIHLWAQNTELIEWPYIEQRMEYYSIFSYLPQVLGLCLGRLLGLGSVLTIYLGRLCMLLTYIFSCYNAIKKTPVGKFIFATMPLLPMSLMMSSAISYDSLVLISTLNFLACSLKLCHEPNSKSALIECMVWAFIVGSVKGGGYLILLPIVFIFFYQDREHAWINAGSVVGSGIISVLLFDVILPAGTRLFQFGGENADKLYASYVLEKPLKYLEMMFETYVVQADSILINMGGTHLARLENTIPASVIVGLMLVIGIFSIYEKDSVQLNNRDKYTFIFIIFLEFILTPAMLLSWTNKGSNIIEGLQGRYYLPVLPLMMLVITKFKLHTENNGKEYEHHRQEVSSLCYNIYALLSCLCIYYMMRLYLVR